MSEAHGSPAALTVVADDGYVLKGCVWRHRAAGGPARPLVIINPATSVRCGYYACFAGFLHANGFDVITYDYRGIGASRPPTLRGFEAGWIDWGRLDFEAVLCFAARAFPGQPLQVAAHSVGGFLIGLAASNHLISRVFTMGAQFAYWGDYARRRRLGMLLKWHVAMPALTALCGYFPGKALGWLEDTPRGVVRDWTARAPRFEDARHAGAPQFGADERARLVAGFAAMRGATLALGVTDDEFGTPAAMHRLLGYFSNSDTTCLHLSPAAFGVRRIGHFAFFHSRFEHTLWPIALEWLRHGRVLPDQRASPAALSPVCETIQRTTS
jgi:predicted alpha/beta hydrolase